MRKRNDRGNLLAIPKNQSKTEHLGEWIAMPVRDFFAMADFGRPDESPGVPLFHIQIAAKQFEGVVHPVDMAALIAVAGVDPRADEPVT